MTSDDDLMPQADYITRMYKRITGHTPIMRLKNEVAVYPLYKLWAFKRDDSLEIFCKLVRKANKKFPENDIAFIFNLMPILRENSHFSTVISWYHGYFVAIMENETQVLLDFIQKGDM